HCLICGSAQFRPRLPSAEIADEIQVRDTFTRRRFRHRPSSAELMDLTGFMHGDEGSLEKCTECGVTVRSEERAAQYENDTYDHELLEVLYPRYRDAFRRKERGYKCLLRP